MPVSVKWNGREIHRQPQRTVVGVIATIGGLLGTLLAFVFLALVIPPSLPLHFLVKCVNGRGFNRGTSRNIEYHVPLWACIPIIAGYIVLVTL